MLQRGKHGARDKNSIVDCFPGICFRVFVLSVEEIIVFVPVLLLQCNGKGFDLQGLIVVLFDTHTTKHCDV